MRWLNKVKTEITKKQKGFSLLEILVAIGILALIVISILRALDTNYKTWCVCDEQAEAVNLAVAHIEAIKELPYASEYPNAIKLLQDFHLEVRESSVIANLEEQTKLLSRLERELQTLMKQNERYHTIIEDAKERIAKAEQDIKTNLQEQELKKQEIEAQKGTVKTVEDKLKNLSK